MATGNTFIRRTLINVLSDLGGLYSSIAAGLIVIFSPLLYNSFNRNLTSKIIAKKSSKDYTTQEVSQILRQRFSFMGLYGLYDKVGDLSKKQSETNHTQKYLALEIEVSELKD